jgi:hypothetical protein
MPHTHRTVHWTDVLKGCDPSRGSLPIKPHFGSRIFEDIVLSEFSMNSRVRVRSSHRRTAVRDRNGNRTPAFCPDPQGSARPGVLPSQLANKTNKARACTSKAKNITVAPCKDANSRNAKATSAIIQANLKTELCKASGAGAASSPSMPCPCG